MTRWSLAVGGLTVLAACGTAVTPAARPSTGAGQAPHRATSVSPGRYVSTLANGPGLAPGDAAHRVAAGLAAARVSGVQMNLSPEDHRSTTPWVVTTLATHAGPTDRGGGIRAQWLGQLAIGGVSDLIRTTQSSLVDVISGGEVREPSADGKATLSLPLGTGGTAGGQVLAAPPDADLVKRAAAVAQTYGMTLKDVRTLHPLGTALDVTFVVPDGLRPRWTISTLTNALQGSPIQLDGTLVTLESPAGEALLVEGGAYRTGSGGLWFAPGQDTRFGALHGALADPTRLAVGPD